MSSPRKAFGALHPVTRPEERDLIEEATQWQRLLIITTVRGGAGDTDGHVEYAAFYQGGQQHERSRFVYDAGQWFYLDGETLPPIEEKIGRNAPCPCGSGKKYKRCCG